MEKATITMPNGVTISVDASLLVDLFKNFEDGIHYNSSSRGRILIEDMATPHLLNAVKKRIREAVEECKSMDRSTFLSSLHKLIGKGDVTTAAMLTELMQRRDG